MTRPNLLVQLSTRERANAFRTGVGDALGIDALGLDPKTLWTLPGIDALYLSLTRAERWGSRPLPPHSVALLRTTDGDQREEMPPYIMAGMALKDDEPNTPAFATPLLVKAMLAVIGKENAKRPGAIRAVGVFEFESLFSDTNISEVARLLAALVAQ